MDIKVLCNCGAKFRFETEPVNGRMAAQVNCPVCGVDATALANAVIQEKLAAQAVPVAVAVAAQPIAVPAAAAPVRVAIAGSAPAVAEAPAPAEAPNQIARCPKHPSEMAAADCFVCGKPICPKCMEQFGYLCSSYCKGQAEARHLDVPVYEGQIFQKRHAEGRSHNRIIMAGAAAATLLLAAYIWYWFVGSRPKLAIRIETVASSPFLHAEWISDEQFFAVTPARVALFNANDGAQVWSVDLPKDEITTSKFGGNLRHGEDDQWFFDFEPAVKLVSKDIWVGLPTRVLRLDGQTGKKKMELPLAQRASEYRTTDTHFLAVSKNETNDSKLLTRVSLADGKLEAQYTPASSGARRIIGTVRPMAGLGNTSLKNFTPADEEFSEFNSISFDRDRDFVFAGDNVAHMKRQLVEARIAVQSTTKKKSGPLIIDKGNMRASQGMQAAEEYFNQNAPDEKIDQSLYSVTIDRYFGAAPQWTGQVAGRPFFFSAKTVDYLVGGTTLIVFNKNNQKLWEAKLTYPIAANIDTDTGPALELGNRLLFFDQGMLTAFDLKKGEVQWRVDSVGISGVTPDSEGNLYLSTSTAGPEDIRYSQQVNFSRKIYPMVVKVELRTGKVLWQSPRTGSNCQISNGYIYTSDTQISGLDRMKTAMGGDGGTPDHWRLYRLSPGSGKDLWEWYHMGAPQAVRPKNKQILLQFKKDLRLLKFL